MRIRFAAGRETLGEDAVAGLVLGVESVPDGLAADLLAGVSPLSGLYAYLFGTIGGSLFTSSTFMAVQATGTGFVHPVGTHRGGHARGRVLRLGYALRFVSNSVLTGYMSAVGVNIILGQLANLTGYKAAGATRIIRALNTLLHPGQLHLQSLAVGVLTIVLILVLERSRASPLGLVLAVMAVVVFDFAGLVGHVAMPALAGSLILIGFRTIKPRELWSV